MPARQSRVWMLWAAGTLAVVGGIVYGFVRYEPEPIDVSSPAAAWSARWKVARTCLVGQSPPADTATDSINIREVWLDSPTASLGKCVGPLGAARFELAETTDSVELDAAWHDVTTGVRAVRDQLHARVVGKRPVANLGPAIDEVNRAYARLRRAAGLAPEPLAAGPALPRYPEGQVLEVGAGEGPALPRRVEVADDLVVVYHHAGSRTRRLTFRNGAVVSNEPVSRLLVAAGDPSWAVVARDVDSSTIGGLEVVPVDADGRATGATPVEAARRPAASATLQARFALGDEDMRAFVYRLVEERAALGLPPSDAEAPEGPPADSDIFEPDTVASLVIAASGDGGKSWGQALSVEGGEHGIAVAEAHARADVWWTSAAVGTSWLRLDRDTLPVIVSAALGAAAVAPLEWRTVPNLESRALGACFADRAAWWVGPDNSVEGALTVFRLAADGAAASERRPAPASAVAEASLLCSNDVLVVRGPAGDGHVCTASECAPWPASDPTGTEVISMTAAGPVSVFAVGDLVFASRPGDARPRPQFRKQLKADIAGAVRWHGVLYLVLHDVDRVRLVPLTPGL